MTHRNSKLGNICRAGSAIPSCTQRGAALVVFGLWVFGSAWAAENPSVIRLDPALDEFVSPDARVELVATGFGFTEGPVWVPQPGGTGHLLFTDIPGNVIYRWTPGNAKAEVFLYNAGFRGADIWRWGGMNDNGRDRSDPRFEEFPMAGANGLTLDRQGRLIICTFAGRSVDRIEPDGARTTLVDNYQGKRFSGTNDVVVKSDGAIYFTDTFGGLRLRAQDPRRELDFNGVYRWKDGQLTLVARDMPNTNGLAFSPDEKILYVDGSRDNYVQRYEVRPDGSLANSRLFIDLRNRPDPGVTDGLRVDTKGNLYQSGPGGLLIITPEGKHLGTIHAPEKAINVAFGDADRKTLYIAAHTSIYKIRVNVPGI